MEKTDQLLSLMDEAIHTYGRLDTERDIVRQSGASESRRTVIQK